MVVQELTAQSWNDNVLSSKLPVIVNFTAVRCGFCKALEPLYSKFSDQYGDRLTFYRLVVDFPANHQILNKVAIQGTPTLKFYCKGREVGEHVGYAIEPVLKKKIDESLQEMESCLANSTPVGR
jgi:thioredoxin 1